MNRPPSHSSAALGAAVHMLLSALGDSPPATASESPTDRSEVVAYVTRIAMEAGLSATEVTLYERDVASLLLCDAPFVVVPFPEERGIAFAALSGGRRVRLLDETGGEQSVSRDALCREIVRSSREHVAAAAARVTGSAAESALSRAVTEELCDSAPVAWGFVFRPETARGVREAASRLQLARSLTTLVALAALESALGMGALWLVGSVALDGHADRGSLLGWALLSLTAVAAKVASTRSLGRITLRGATFARQRLLRGALELDPDTLGGRGMGGLLVTAGQADALVGAVIALGFSALSAIVNLVGAVVVLLATPAPAPSFGLTLLFGALALVAASVPRSLRLAEVQQAERTRLTTETVERLVGHRTRLVQQSPRAWHDGEDTSLLAYATEARAFDRHKALLRALPRAYALAAVSVAFTVLVATPTPLTLALALGGTTVSALAISALVEVSLGACQLVSAFRAVRPLVEKQGEAIRWVSAAPCEDARTGTTLELRGVRFSYASRHAPILDDASLTVSEGDRVLVCGRSGSGKTTLAALIAGLRRPTHGLVIVGGLDQHTLGELDLRRCIAAAPQFYKNHVFTGSLAYNLLLGRAWPPSKDDLARAEEVARELGLGPLLERMPAGLFQHVGETGWQLSHGEKSRVFLARALLQRASTLVLDETFGALDPATLARCVSVASARARSLVVITHG